MTKILDKIEREALSLSEAERWYAEYSISQLNLKNIANNLKNYKR